MKNLLLKKTLYVLVWLIPAGVAIAFVYHWLQEFDTPGYVLMGIGHWSLETSLTVFSIFQIISFFVFYFLLRTLSQLISLPGRLKQRSKLVKFNRSQEALIAGLVDSAEGNWEKAENVLIKHASHSGAPLLHYLTAAKAAQSRGAIDKRDEYLKKATDHAPDSAIAIGLTQAELHLSGNEFDRALETLTNLHSIQPGHASVLKLMHQTYQTMGDWEGIRKLLPSLYTHKVLMEAEIKLLETEAFSRLLRQAAESGDIDLIQSRWAEVPNYIRKISGVSAIYFAAMISAGAGADIEDELALTLSIDWDATLLVLFGSVPSNDTAKQLAMAERWLSLHENDAVLLTVLGKLSAKCADHEKARAYLSQSIASEPTVQAYQLLAELLTAEGQQAEASECYKKGLELASSEIISRINTVS
jgi:HemY protein